MNHSFSRLMQSLILGHLLIVSPLVASPYIPEGPDYAAFREAVTSPTAEERAAAFIKISEDSVAALTLATLLHDFGLIERSATAPLLDKIKKRYQTEVEDKNTGKKRMETRFPPIREADIFIAQPVVGTYQDSDLTLQVVAMPADCFFINKVNEKFWTGKPEFLAAGSLTDKHNGSAKNNGIHYTLKDQQLYIQKEDGSTRNLKKVEITSPSLGLPAPPNAQTLIDSAGQAKGMRTQWKTADNALEISDGGCVSNQKAQGKIRLHLEFRAPHNPATLDQQRGNSGFFVGPYEIQVNDNFGFQHALNQCGGIYFIADPLKNASLPPAIWQTYDAVFTPDTWSEDDATLLSNARITVKLNGEVIHDDLELVYPDAKKQAEKKLYKDYSISLQNHSNKVQYRNLWWVQDI